MCVVPEGEEIVHLEIGEERDKETKSTGTPKDAESAKQELERGMSYVLSRFAGKPIDVTVGPEEGIVAKAALQMFLCGEDAFVNLGTPAKSLEEAKQNGTVERCKITAKMAYITGVK